MKHILKKNQVIITALAIMIAVAGYLNFTQDKVEDGITTQLVDTKGETDSGTVETVSNKVTQDDFADTQDLTQMEDNQDDYADISAEDIGGDQMNVADNGELETADEDGAVGEAVLANNTISSDFFASAKLNREQTRAKNKEMLMEIVDNKNLTESQKQDALNNIIKLTEVSEMETATETLLSAKGFDGTVVSIVDNSVDVVVNAKDLTEQQIAQIQDIVKRKTSISSENIVITPVAVK